MPRGAQGRIAIDTERLQPIGIAMSLRPNWIIGIVAITGLAVFVAPGCSSEDGSDDDSFPTIEVPDVEGVDAEAFVEPDVGTERDADVEVDAAADADAGGEGCELEFELPPGDSYALRATGINEPSTIAGLAQSYMDSVPPVVFFADGLGDGLNDELEIAGGVGERTGFGIDETPNTPEDIYGIYYGSISADTCDFQVRLHGETVNYQLVAHADEMELDLSGFSSLTEGMVLHVEDVEMTAEFSEDLVLVNDAVLGGVLSDEGLDDLLEVVREQIPISREQAMDLLDPDDTGEILVELELEGMRAHVEGFMDATEELDPVEPRTEEPCCPDGLDVGDSVIPYLTWGQQGINDRQRELLQMALPEFRDDPHIAMVTTAYRQADGEIHYEVYAGGAVEEGWIIFTRQAGDDAEAPSFEIIEQSGVNPLANTSPTALSSYEEFLATGVNPNAVTYADHGYFADDPRLSFVPADEMHYPYAMERISQNFDDPRTGDLIIIPASWSTGGFGTHGNLGSLQSRSPMVISGPGIRDAATGDGADATVEPMPNGAETLLLEDAVRQVDIAPTVAAALGVEHTTGVGPDLRLRDDVYLGWQDGRVLEEIFTSSALDAIEQGEPVADHAVIIINDGLTNTELLFQVLSDDDDFEVDAYRDFFSAGMAFRHGSISNFPSNTYPGHNTIGAGAWGGHHGIIDNQFWVREQATEARPIRELFETEHLMGSAHDNLPVETLHEAVVRTFGDLENDNLAASINDPSSRGAELATLERRHPQGFQMPDEADDIEIGGELFTPPPADIQDYTGLMDNASLQTFAEVYQDHIRRGDEGLPIPKVSIVNFGSTDTAGHTHGPHGDYERYEVIARVNQRMRIMQEVLEYLEIDDSTMIVLTSDHGMELQDTSRASSRHRALVDAGVSFRNTRFSYYFKELAVQFEEVNADGDEATFTFRVIDKGTEDTEEPVGIEDIEVSVVADGDGEALLTDREGYVDIVVTPHSGADSVLFQFDDDDWNMHRERFGL